MVLKSRHIMRGFLIHRGSVLNPRDETAVSSNGEDQRVSDQSCAAAAPAVDHEVAENANPNACRPEGDAEDSRTLMHALADRPHPACLASCAL